MYSVVVVGGGDATSAVVVVVVVVAALMLDAAITIIESYYSCWFRIESCVADSVTQLIDPMSQFVCYLAADCWHSVTRLKYLVGIRSTAIATATTKAAAITTSTTRMAMAITILL